MRPMFRLAYRPEVHGTWHVPRTGPAIIASNHLSEVDSLVIPMVTPRPIAFLAKAEYFTGPGLKGWASRSFFTGCGAVPVERGNGRAALAALETAEQILDRGEVFGIYPEGTRSPDGRLYRGRLGVARLALKTGAPVIPVGLVGTDAVQPIGQRVPRIGPVTVRFGAPLEFSRYRGLERNRTVQRAVVDEIMRAILELSQQDYVDHYGSTSKAA